MCIIWRRLLEVIYVLRCDQAVYHIKLFERNDCLQSLSGMREGPFRGVNSRLHLHTLSLTIGHKAKPSDKP